MNRRHLVALALALLTLAVLLSGCAAEYRWVRDGPPAARVQWIVVAYADLHKTCGTDSLKAPNLGGCAFYSKDFCTVYSFVDENEASTVMSGDGLDLREHELRHCAGFIHQ